jgi:hypothetical protein
VARVYPDSLFDHRETLVRQLGSFWSNEFQDRAFIRSCIDGHLELKSQFGADYEELVNLLSIPRVPVYHRERLYKLTLRESDMNAGESGKLTYGDAMAVYGAQPDDSYGQTGQIFMYGGDGSTGPGYVFDLPETIARCMYFITDRLKNPEIVLVNGMDYLVTPGVSLRLRVDPFTQFQARDICNSLGEVIDREIDLWGHQVDIDRDYLNDHAGCILGLDVRSTEPHRLMTVTYWNMLRKGATVEEIRIFLSAITGSPVARDSERVENILVYPDRYKVVTDKRVYSHTAPPIVTRGQDISLGDELFDVFSVVELAGNNSDLGEIDSLAFGSNFLSGGYRGELVFENASVSLDYGGLDDDGRAMVTFRVSGYNEDIEKFWDNMMSRGKETGNTLAELLDRREVRETQPGPLDLPSSVNPLQFVVDNLVGNNLIVINIGHAELITEDMPGFSYLRFLRSVLPPHTTFIVRINTATLEEELVGVDGDEGMNITEGDIEAFYGDHVEESMEITLGDL